MTQRKKANDGACTSSVVADSDHLTRGSATRRVLVTSSGDELYGINICNTYKKPSDLIKYLTELHEDLQKRDQDLDKTPPGFKETVQFLIVSKLLENPEKKIRLLVSCCFVDVFRIYAPETPYKDPIMLKVFDVIILQIRNLQTALNGSDEQSKVIYMIQSLSRVKSCVIPVIMAQRGINGALEIVQSLFRALIESVRPEHDDEVLSYCVEIMHACIVEYEGIPEEWIDTLLLPLLTQNKTENPTAYKIIAGTLRSVGPLPVVQQCFAQLANDILVNPSGGRDTEVTEEIYSVIYELHLVHPPLLYGIIPTITVLLKVENDEIRSKIIKLLAKLYTSDIFDYTKQFEKEFREFAARINDRSFLIRNDMVETIILLISLRPELKSSLEDLISKKLRDPEEEIRLHTLSKLLDFAQTNITSLSQETYDEICERVKDKKIEVRRIALIGLSKLYYRHISSALPAISEINGIEADSITFGISAEIIHRLESVPSIVLKSWGFPDFPTKHLIVHLLQEYILPKTFKIGNGEGKGDDYINQVRASALLLLFRCMKEDVDKVSFGAILNFKGKVAEEVNHFLILKSLKSGNGGGADSRLSSGSLNSTPIDDTDRIAEIRQSLYNLTMLIPISDKKHTVFDRLISSKDKYVIKMLELCISASDTIQSGLQHKEEIQKRLDSKSVLGEYIGVVYDFAGHFLFDQHVVNHLLKALISTTSQLDSAEIAEVVSFLCRFTSKAFSGTAHLFKAWVSLSIIEKNDKGRQKQKKEKLFASFVSAAIASSKWLQNDESKIEFAEKLIHFCQVAYDPVTCLQLGEVIGHLTFVQYHADVKNNVVSLVQKYLQTLCNRRNLHVGNVRILHNLCGLSSLIRVPPVAYEKADTIKYAAHTINDIISALKPIILKFLFDELFQSEDTSVEAKSVGLRIIANMLCCEEDYERTVSSIGKNQSSSFTKVLSQLSCLIFECIATDGKLFAGKEIKDAEDQLQILEASAIDALILSRVHVFAQSISVNQWQELAWIIVKSDRDVKKQLLNYLISTIQVHPVHLKFLALPCLFANDPEFAELAQKSLIFAIKRLRRTHEELSAKLVTEKDENIRERLKLYSQFTTPEMVLPYLLYLLSYHPDFPSSMLIETEEDSRKVKDVVKCIQMLIHSLQATLRNETSNLPFLFKQLNTIMHKYVDREDDENVGLHFVTRLALKMLTDQVKTADNLQVYPGEIVPPDDLFAETEAGTAQKLLNRVAAEQGNGTDDAESAITKALNATQRTKKIPLASPGRTNSAPAKLKQSPDRKEKKRHIEENAKEAAKKKKFQELVEEIPLRALPKRNAKAVASYVEVDEDESEVEKWNEDAAKKPIRKGSSPSLGKTGKTPLIDRQSPSLSQSSRFSSKIIEQDEDDFDFFKNLPASASTSRPQNIGLNVSSRPSSLKRKLSDGNRSFSNNSSMSSENGSIFISQEENGESGTDDLFENDTQAKKGVKSKTSSADDERGKSNKGLKFNAELETESALEDGQSPRKKAKNSLSMRGEGKRASNASKSSNLNVKEIGRMKRAVRGAGELQKEQSVSVEDGNFFSNPTNKPHSNKRVVKK